MLPADLLNHGCVTVGNRAVRADKNQHYYFAARGAKRSTGLPSRSVAALGELVEMRGAPPRHNAIVARKNRDKDRRIGSL
jgi:hypothetical protein